MLQIPRAPVNRAILAVALLAAVSLAGCFQHRTEKAAEDTPMPEGWTDRQVTERKRPGGAPDVTVALSYPRDSDVTQLITDLWSGLERAGWTTDVVYGEGIGMGDMGQVTGASEDGPNAPIEVACLVDATHRERQPSDPVVLVCTYSVRGGGV